MVQHVAAPFAAGGRRSRDGTFTRYAHDGKTNKITRAIPNQTMDIKWAWISLN